MKKSYRKIFIHIFIILFGIVMIYPLLWMLSSSFKFSQDIFTSKTFFPRVVTLENYIKGWQGMSGYTFGVFLLNSVFVSLMCILGNFFCCTMAAYAFAKLDFAFKKVYFAIMLGTLMLPFHVTLIPQYILFNKLHWIDTYLPFIVPKFLGGQGFFIFLLVQYMRTIPRELDDAAKIDGCGKIGIFIKLMLPLSLPAIISMAILTFLWTWNDFFSQLLYLNSIPKFTISIALRMFIDATSGSQWGSMFAMSIVSIIPLFLIFVFLQRYIVEGITAGAIKG
ncbi:MAG: carbohydrate ABC transporter permease [Clostridiales bacterium]|nr:carbohydrate ABC transporter permease [Clostridiales bacterium]